MYRGLGKEVCIQVAILRTCVYIICVATLSLSFSCSHIVTVSFVWLHCHCLSLVPSEGPAGNLVFGYLSGQPVVCMQGRFHFYEPCVWLILHGRSGQPCVSACRGDSISMKLILHGRYGGMCALTSSKAHPPWKVWACVHLLVAKLFLHGRYGHVCTTL